MQLERLSARIRPRPPWESVDLGFALARRWFLPLWSLWWLTAALPAALLLIPLHRRPDLWVLAIWWLKPLLDALLLFWLARALFGEREPVTGTLRRLRQAFPPRLWPHLLWRRFGTTRSFTMPVTLLERLTGRRRRQRLGVLAARGGVPGWLTIICVHLEAVLWMSALMLLVILIPEPLPALDLGALLTDDASLGAWLGALCTVAAMSVIAPFYVAAGFALYLGRRTELEAWDLELRFRQQPLPERQRAIAPAGALLLAVLALLASIQPLSPAGAATEATMPTSDQARDTIDAVLAGEDFGSTRERKVWTYIGDAGDHDEETPASAKPSPLLLTIATVLKWALAIAATAALLLLLYRLTQELRGLRAGARGRRPDNTAAPVLHEAAPPLMPLPADITAAAQSLLAAGDTRAALSLLYRAQIAHLRDTGLDIPDSATEADCLAAAARFATRGELDWLRRLTGLWQAVAYAHRGADPRAVRHLLETRPGGEASQGAAA
jgi:hypothetical protein